MNVSYIKRYLSTKINCPITIIYYGSRNRKERYQGKLWKIYNNVFIIKLSNGDIKSFTYIDILTKTIQIYI